MIRSCRRPPTARRGFTIVELLVATALSVMIMAIMATAFSIAMDSLSLLKSTAVVAGDLRAADTVLRRDLEAQHLEDPDGVRVLVSDAQVSAGAWTGNDRRGFFKVRHGTPLRQHTSTGLPTALIPYPAYVPNVAEPRGIDYPYLLEGTDADGNQSFRATDHSLHMTVKLTGKLPEDVFSSRVPGGLGSPGPVPAILSLTNQHTNTSLYVGKWAEVAYFLKPSGQFTLPDPDPALNMQAVPLYTLHRRQRVLLPASVTVAATLDAAYPDLSLIGSPATQINTPATITTSGNRLNLDVAQNLLPSLATPADAGTDIVLTNVVSFQVRLIEDPFPTPVSGDGTNYAQAIPGSPTVAVWTYDTANPVPGAGTKTRPRAVQIKLRVYEPKNHLTRQLTILQPL